jgi:shikimate O-hydroxycinnamoyltransferase
MATLVQRKLDITVRKRSMVPPIEPTPERVLWNSNVDLVIPRIHTQSVYFYPNDGSDDFFNHEKLVEALGKTLVPFYPMAGRLKRGVDGRIEINCNGEGVLLVEAEADAEVADFGEFAPDPRFQQLVPQVDYTQDVSSYPLLCLQVGLLDPLPFQGLSSTKTKVYPWIGD